MITILTYPEDDTTKNVADWVNYMNREVVILNSDEFFYLHSVKIGAYVEQDKENNVFWFRKWRNPGRNKKDRESFYMQLDAFISQNMNGFWLNNLYNLLKGKGMQLKAAFNCGFDIPCTLITMNKQEITSFLNSNENRIIKFSDIQNKKINKKFCFSYTQILTLEKLEQIELDVPCIVQEYIEKEVEIRTFFLNGKCYSMAIFSQNDEQTKIDFRKYNHTCPNRNVPIKLPIAIEDKITKLMGKLEMNCGSLDIIFTPAGEYVFLEVNPVGQFGMVSYPCNYHLEKEVAELLIEKSDSK